MFSLKEPAMISFRERPRMGSVPSMWSLVIAAIISFSPDLAAAKAVTLIEFFGLSFMEGQRGVLAEGDTNVTIGSDWVAWSYANDTVTWRVTADFEPALPGGWGVFPPSIEQPICELDGCNWITFFPFAGRLFLEGETGSAHINPALTAPEPESVLGILVGLALLTQRLRRHVASN